MRLRLAKEQCVGHALCHATDPDLFPIDDDGYSSIDSVEVGPAVAARARRGVGACPERALLLEE
ncbi:ferredoxin [Actinomadura sp. LD22]|uniref:Ferredoxin n=1 Tax=Actinomadura physcomitrii TaxID=2650748 RepID=A0A6I4MRF1_9ACTN|nr:ferredoxin [Actinomadura physcomitrii]